MSALYGLVIIGAWLGLTAWFWKIWRRRRGRPDANRRAVDAAGILFLLLWVGVSFWYGGGRNIYYDWQVRELCAKDGGVKVYETVKLPAEMFDQYAKRNWILPEKAQMKPIDEYYFESETYYFRKGNPQVSRREYRVVRRSDQKILGELVLYGRGGGDLPGPWHGSSFTCPDLTQVHFESAIFVKGEKL